LTTMPEAKIAAAKRPIVTRRIARGPILAANLWPIQARVPFAVPIAVIAPTMHCMHMRAA
jgi:hypothetical protein